MNKKRKDFTTSLQFSSSAVQPNTQYWHNCYDTQNLQQNLKEKTDYQPFDVLMILKLKSFKQLFYKFDKHFESFNIKSKQKVKFIN